MSKEQFQVGEILLCDGHVSVIEVEYRGEVDGQACVILRQHGCDQMMVDVKQLRRKPVVDLDLVKFAVQEMLNDAVPDFDLMSLEQQYFKMMTQVKGIAELLGLKK